MYFQHLCADNDYYGNPRRLYVLVDEELPVATRVAAWDEGYAGHHAVPSIWRDCAYLAERMDISVTLYKELRRNLPGPKAAHEVPGFTHLCELV
jgi:hypothetical protein